MNMSFENLGLSKELLKSVEDMGFEEPSPIQVLTIPPLMEGHDIVGQAQTGTGKTAAFGIPILERVEPKNKSPQALVLCPTRELAIQVAEEIGKLASRKRGIFALPIYGGQPIERQFRALAKGAQIIVGTPGRVIDHLERGTLRFNDVTIAVLDEADEMLDMGFRDDIEAILEQTPVGCQRVFFSATMPPAIMDMARRFLNDPQILKITQKLLTVPTIEQVYYEVRPHQKMDALCRVLDSQGFRKALVFCSTKRSVDEVTMHLQARGYQADGLHGNLAQQQRDRVMGRFRTGGIEILVATDVAARGIDVDDVDAVINYDIPNDVEAYVHRIGRTGRAGRAGRAFTFVSAREHYKLRDIIRYTKARIIQNQLPTLRDVANIRTTRLLEEVRTTMDAGSLERYTNLVEQFLDEDNTSMDMAAALLKLLMQREFGQSEQQDERKEDTLSGWRERHSDKVAERVYGRQARPQEKRGGPGQKHAKHGMDRLFFNVGSKMHVAPRDLVGAIAGEAGIPGRSIGAIEIHDRFAFVEVPTHLSDDVITVMNGSQIRGFKVAVEKAVPKK
ncbi:DEAD/DEAH box helicase [Desulfovibrio sp. OttesenSCG-928-G15]|nr:DEAD/DEAH box helicase [Desulfovibrio sp. OttesenSCG-928-G15]